MDNEELRDIDRLIELIDEVKRLRYCLKYVGARLYLDKNENIPYDYSELLDYCINNSGEPDDMSGEMGAMITEMLEAEFE
jgi:hypothetical protein